MFKHATVLAFSLVAGTASAQDTGWTYKASLYGWLPSMSATVETDFGDIESDASGSDVLSNLEFGFFGTISAQNGPWGFVGDFMYASVADTKATPRGLLFDSATLDLELSALSGYALYRLSNDLPIQFDVGVGFRSFDIGIDATAGGGALGDREQSVGESWTDPLLAARLMVPFDDEWFLAGFADWGGTSSDDETYQVYTGIGYNFNDAWSAQLGYRYMNISRELKGHDVDIGLSGVLIGATYSF